MGGRGISSRNGVDGPMISIRNARCIADAWMLYRFGAFVARW